MPPPAAATKNVLEGLGIPAISATRPSKFAGPTVRQRKPASVRESSVCASAVIAPLVRATPARSGTIRKRGILTPEGGTRRLECWRRYSYEAPLGSVESLGLRFRPTPRSFDYAACGTSGLEPPNPILPGPR